MSDLTKQQMDALLAVFAEEAAQLSDELGTILDDLRDAPRDRRAELVSQGLRVTHSIKGAASSVGYGNVELLAHKLEEALSRLNVEDEEVSQTPIKALRHAAASIQRLIEHDDHLPGLDLIMASVVTTVLETGATEKQENLPQSDPIDGTGSDFASHLKASSSVRVDASTLDDLMNLTGELFSAQQQLEVRRATLERLLDSLQDALKEKGEVISKPLAKHTSDFEAFVEAERREATWFHNLVSEIGTTVKVARMLPLEEAATFWRRVVREVSLEQGKDVRLTVDVKEIKIDRAIFDSLREPMLHLLRNAVDHGIEAADVRAAAEKPEAGSISIVASLIRGMVRLEISDDGGGLDHGSIRKLAVERGLIEGEEQLTSDIFTVLSRDRFSTREQATKFSGRGVGLAVVRERLDSMNGQVEVRSPGRLGGTTFALTFPVGILSTKGLLVRAGEMTYAIPSDSIVRTLRVERTLVTQVNGEPVVQLHDGTPLRLARLAELMGYDARETTRRLTIVITRAETATLGLIVSEIIGEQEFVTKPLPWNLKGVEGVSGAVPLASGSPAIVLDIPFLVSSSNQRGLARRVSDDGREPTSRILVVDDSLTARTIAQSTLLTAGYEVTLASNGEEAWQKLQTEHFDLVVSDVQMPFVGGFELTRRIRSQNETKQIPVILVTKCSSREDTAQGAAAGADEYIVKGKLERDKLLNAVRRLMPSGNGH